MKTLNSSNHNNKSSTYKRKKGSDRPTSHRQQVPLFSLKVFFINKVIMNVGTNYAYFLTVCQQ
jgi:hypothetical protein